VAKATSAGRTGKRIHLFIDISYARGNVWALPNVAGETFEFPSRTVSKPGGGVLSALPARSGRLKTAQQKEEPYR